MYYLAYEMAEKEQYTPDLEDRLAFLKLASACALVVGSEAAAARSEHERARQLHQAYRLQEARDVLQRALELYPGGKSTLGFVIIQLADLERKLGNQLRAIELADEFDELALLHPELAGSRGQMQRTRGYAYLDLGMPDLAWKWIEPAWKQAEEGHRKGELAMEDGVYEWRRAYMHLLLALGDDDRAIELIEGFLEDETAYGQGSYERAFLTVLQGAMLVEREIEDPDLSERGAGRIREVIASLDPRRRFYARLTLAEEALHKKDWDAAAQEFSRIDEELEWDPQGNVAVNDLLRLPTLQAHLALGRGSSREELVGVRDTLQRAVDTFLKQWENLPEREGGIGYLLYSRRRDSIGELIRLSIAIDGEEEGARQGFERLLQMQARGTIAHREGARSVGVETLRAGLLGDGHGILAYLPTRSVSHVFALDEAGLIHEELPPSYEIERVRRRYLSHLLGAAGNLEDDREWALDTERRWAAALSEALLPPPIVARLASWSSVTIAGADSLDRVPFAWLPVGDEPHLGTRWALDYLHSLPLGAVWAGRVRAPADLDYVLVAGAQHGASVQGRWPDLVPIPLAGDLRSDLLSSFDAERTRVLEGGSATRAELKRIDLARVAILQFLVHGVREPGRERPLALVLTGHGEDDGLFRYEDAASSRAPAFVVLTGCRTGQGPVRKGDPDIGNLGGAWLSAGAQAVLQAQTDLSLARARRSSRAIFESLKEGDCPAEALRRSRLELLEAHGPQAPFRDGLLQITGLGMRPIFVPGAGSEANGESRGPGGWWMGAAGFLVGLVVMNFLKRSRAGVAG